ncbi:MAG: DNA topoisomerase IV subunit A [Alphaproteobacteria bacterium]|nr:DNA topoisomerase IV subunit A [Alphaproteobacteria bacterium]
MSEARRVRETPFVDVLGERYVSYALSTIMSRSLPDVRDGLKPVHRRLLYAMRALRLDPTSGFKKCARVVGDVIGKYHPHGDQAVYDAMVRLAQEFAIRYPLVDGQGNFGNVDGDGAAAMRYTEARLTAVADALLEGLDEDAVDFVETYDGEDSEPAVLPAAFPNLLANGAQGIAVGMATSIPPHNADEICRALLHLLHNPGARLETLMRHLPGPDFPTGGVLLEGEAALQEAYRSGRGRFRLRAAWAAEPMSRGRLRVVVREIPWGIPKARIVTQLDELVQARKLPWLAEIRDESADDVRVVLELRGRGGEPAELMEVLFRLTDLETRVSLNLNVLDGGRVPRVMGLAEVLQAWLDHRREVLLRRSRHRLQALEKRIHVLEGYLLVFADLDTVIQIIRETDEPRSELMEVFRLTETQAEAVLNMRLRTLRRLEEEKLRVEHARLAEERNSLTDLVESEALQWERIETEIRDVRARFGAEAEGGARRTRIDPNATAREPRAEHVEAAEPVTLICSRRGWVRVVRGHVENESELRYRDDDEGRFIVRSESTADVLVATDKGRLYTLSLSRLPGGRGFGEPIRLHAQIGNDEELVACWPADPRPALLATEDGRGFLAQAGDLIGSRSGRQVVTAAARLVVCRPAVGDHVAVVGTNRKLLIFAASELPQRSRGQGVYLQRYRTGHLSDAVVFAKEEGLVCRTGTRTRTFAADALTPWTGKRGQSGRTVPKGFPSSLRFD